ncbi:MAG: TetR/AcrR family transcriptional regulator [Segniliparus sp.]|uniref:TetR/AcrR family transcriptional regulator n=1 Tax=Segniliparus sp. TaxID=2804064 RepID=UPI003F3A0D45
MPADHTKTFQRGKRRLTAPERREVILEAAKRVFAANGYNAGMGEVATASGVRRTVLYHYFPTKKDLYLAVVEAQVAKLMLRMEPTFNAEDGPDERMRQKLSVIVDFVEDDPDAWDIVCATTPGSSDSEIRALQREIRSVVRTGIVDFLRNSPDSAMLDELDFARPAAIALFEITSGGLISVTRWWRRHPEVSRAEIEEVLFVGLWLGSRSAYLGEQGAVVTPAGLEPAT